MNIVRSKLKVLFIRTDAINTLPSCLVRQKKKYAADSLNLQSSELQGYYKGKAQPSLVDSTISLQYVLCLYIHILAATFNSINPRAAKRSLWKNRVKEIKEKKYQKFFLRNIFDQFTVLTSFLH